MVVASAENTRHLHYVVLMLGDPQALWLNLQPALVNVSCYLDSWPLSPRWFNVAQLSNTTDIDPTASKHCVKVHFLLFNYINLTAAHSFGLPYEGCINYMGARYNKDDT